MLFRVNVKNLQSSRRVACYLASLLSIYVILQVTIFVIEDRLIFIFLFE